MKRTLCCLVLLCAAAIAPAQQPKKTIRSAADLPQFSFPMKQPASVFLTADDAAFAPFANQVEADVNSILAGYTITDKETLRELLGTREEVQLLNGDLKGALSTVEQVRGLEEKQAARLTTGLTVRAYADAAQQTSATSGAAFDEAFQHDFAAELDTLPWSVASETIKGMRTGMELLSENALVGRTKFNLDP